VPAGDGVHFSGVPKEPGYSGMLVEAMTITESEIEVSIMASVEIALKRIPIGDDVFIIRLYVYMKRNNVKNDHNLSIEKKCVFS
jgi:hypothetical protein